jgi:hypothetical protein
VGESGLENPNIDSQGNGTKLRMSKSLEQTLKNRVKEVLVYDTLTITYGLNQIQDGGTSRNYFDLCHSGPKLITEMIVDSEEEMKEIQDSLHPIKYTNVRSIYLVA